MLIGGALYLVLYAFQAAALFRIAKREGFRNKWMAFVPFFNTYYVGVCAQKNKIYRIDTRKFALAVAIVEAVTVAGFVLYYVSAFLLKDYLSFTSYCPIEGLPNYRIISGYSISADLPESLGWAAFMYEYGYDYIIQFFELAYLLLNILLVMAFFKTYAPKNFLLYTLLCIFFPISSILYFAVSGNRAMNYVEYVRAEQEKRYRMHQQYYAQYGNPYNRGNGGAGGPNPYEPPRSGGADDPFGEFSEGSGGGQSGEDPFEDYKH